MQLSDMTKSMIGLRSLSFEVSKRVHTMYTKLVLYSKSDAKLSKGADVDGEKKLQNF